MPFKDPARRREASRASAARRRLRAAEERAKALEGPLPPPLTRDELLRLLSVRAREGHVPAIRLLLLELRRDERSQPAGGATFDELDELAERRRKGQAS